MNKIFNKIEKCEGAKSVNKNKEEKNCYGLSYGLKEEIKPVVLKVKSEKIKTMVITEQPYKGVSKNTKSTSDIHWEKKNSIPWKLKELLGAEFKESIENGDGRFYWTHFIKCPGNFRKGRKGKIYREGCADKFLEEEIKELQPDHIISVGALGSSWLIKKYKDKNKDWREYLWQQIVDKKTVKIKINGKEIPVIFLPHPSGNNPLGWFIAQKLKDFIKKII
ncbi:MAG: hypothetical protein ABIM62_02285 [candidate division WOR-3 bacterium]